MKRQYKHLIVGSEELRGLDAVLTELGAEGWRVVQHQLSPAPERGFRDLHFFLLERTEEEAREAKYLADLAEQGITFGIKP